MNGLLLYGFLPVLAPEPIPAGSLPDSIVAQLSAFPVETKKEKNPSFLLPLNENTIKHGISAIHEKGVIPDIIERNENKLHCIVENNNAGWTVTQNTRVMPKNSRNYRLMVEPEVPLLRQNE